jgi:Trypsin-like serine proteases, typically periplasmic, contain C-terminal PDZ domain
MKKLVTLIILLLALFSLTSISRNRSSLKDNLSSTEKVKVVSEESITIDIVKKIGPSVVTIAEESATGSGAGRSFNFGPFSIFGIPEDTQSVPAEPQSIGTGFIIDQDGLVLTNKHVVSGTNVKYQITTSTEKKYDVTKIYRDPLNDVALLQINKSQNPTDSLTPIELGDSSKLQVGQYVVAIGTALGEF